MGYAVAPMQVPTHAFSDTMRLRHNHVNGQVRTLTLRAAWSIQNVLVGIVFAFCLLAEKPGAGDGEFTGATWGKSTIADISHILRCHSRRCALDLRFGVFALVVFFGSLSQCHRAMIGSLRQWPRARDCALRPNRAWRTPMTRIGRMSFMPGKPQSSIPGLMKSLLGGNLVKSSVRTKATWQR